MKYVTRKDGEWFPIGDKLSCCDCKLVHNIAAKVVKGQVFLKVIQDSRATAQRRRATQT